MNNAILRLCFSFGLLAACTAQARTPVAIVNIESRPLAAASAKPLSLETIKAALVSAGAAKNWSFEHTAPGQAIGTLTVRNKHAIKVDILYTPNTLSIRYRDSINMKYQVDEEGSKVHPNFNVWINELAQGVGMEMVKF